MAMKGIDTRRGVERIFWRNVDKLTDGTWLWTGSKNTNHNGVDCEKYEYGEFILEDRLEYPQSPVIATKMAHRISVYLTYGVEVPSDKKTGYEVFPFNGNHLDVNPENLGIRSLVTREEWPAAVFCAASDNGENSERLAA